MSMTISRSADHCHLAITMVNGVEQSYSFQEMAATDCHNRACYKDLLQKILVILDKNLPYLPTTDLYAQDSSKQEDLFGLLPTNMQQKKLYILAKSIYQSPGPQVINQNVFSWIKKVATQKNQYKTETIYRKIKRHFFKSPLKFKQGATHVRVPLEIVYKILEYISNQDLMHFAATNSFAYQTVDFILKYRLSYWGLKPAPCHIPFFAPIESAFLGLQSLYTYKQEQKSKTLNVTFAYHINNRHVAFQPRNEALTNISHAITIIKQFELSLLFDCPGSLLSKNIQTIKKKLTRYFLKDLAAASNAQTLISEGKWIENAKALIAIGANINTPDENQRSFLYYAVKTASLELTNYLLEVGADPNNHTLELLADLDNISLEIQLLLLEKGAISKKIIRQFQSALNDNLKIAPTQISILSAIAKYPLKFAPHPDASAIDYQNFRKELNHTLSYFYIHPEALYRQYILPTKILHAFAQLEVDFSVRDAFKRTALHYAVWKKNIEVTKVLLNQGVHPDVCDDKLDTAVDLAVDLPEILLSLLRAGASPFGINRSLLQTALMKNNEHSLTLLLEYGGKTNVFKANDLYPLINMAIELEHHKIAAQLQKYVENLKS